MLNCCYLQQTAGFEQSVTLIWPLKRERYRLTNVSLRICCFRNVGNQTTKDTTRHIQIKTLISISQYCNRTQLLHYDISDVIWPDISTNCDVRAAITGIKWPADRRLSFCSNVPLFCYLLSHINIPYQLPAREWLDHWIIMTRKVSEGHGCGVTEILSRWLLPAGSEGNHGKLKNSRCLPEIRTRHYPNAGNEDVNQS
jgi:hypothetical protein